MSGRGVATLALAIGMLAGFGHPLPARSEDESTLTDDELVVRQEAGHRLLIPKDWPIERRDGVIQPASLPQYLSMKFSQMRAEFARVEQRLAALETRVATVESERAVLLRRLQMLEERVATAERAAMPTPQPAATPAQADEAAAPAAQP